VRELKGFARVDLQAGETRTVVIELTPRAFERYDSSEHAWRLHPGPYEIAVGSSSRDLRLRTTVAVPESKQG
jgi:beta-glucosidase